MADFDALARAHMAQQVREAAVVQVALGRLWERMIDPADISGSFLRFQAVAARFIGAGRVQSEATAQLYYDALRELGEVDSVPAEIARQPIEATANTKALAAAANIPGAKAKIGLGHAVDTVLSTMQAAVLRSAKRRVLDAGRQRLIASAGDDQGIRGWARVSDGNPCHFCAMLVSRGPVYSDDTVRFHAHDGCGCSVRLVPRSDPSGGWSGDARQLRDLWDAYQASDTTASWRTFYGATQTP